MIKEKKKITKYNFKKSNAQIALEYTKTVLISLFVAAFITLILAMQARNEMLSDIYSMAEEQNLMDRKLAIEIITQENLLRDLKNKTYSVCMHAGEIYETAEDYKDAQRAYELAIEKSKPNNYKPYYRLVRVLAAQDKFKKAEAVLNNIVDCSQKDLIKFKTGSYIIIGDKFYSNGKFLSAAKTYEKANFYYNKFSKKDSKISNAIEKRIIKAYINTADIMVKTGLNSEAIRFLKKAEAYSPEDFDIRYKIAIVLSDLDPEESVKYFDSLLEEKPQNIDCGVINNALMKAANIADLDGRPTQAKYYRYKIHSIDLFVNRKVIYKNDVETTIKSFSSKKVFFKYPLSGVYQILNVSNSDIVNLQGDFVLCINDKPVETVTQVIANKDNPLLANIFQGNIVNVKFKRKVLTKKELDNYSIKIYLYKDKKYKTFIGETSIPKKSF